MDFVRTEPGDDPIIVEGYFAVTPETMFQAWTDPDIVMKWFGQIPNSLHSAHIDLRQGGYWQFLKSRNAEKSVGFEGEYLDIVPGTRLVFTWSQIVAHASGQRDATPSSRVEVTFKANGIGTDLRVVHSAVPTEDLRRGFAGGWAAAFATMTQMVT